jgi:hypothetical protein
MAIIERINGSFLAKLSGSSSETAASAGAGGINFTYDSVNLSDGLRRLQQAFQNSSERLVSTLAAFEGVRQVLVKLVDLTGNLEKIAERAARDGVADTERRSLNFEFQKIVSEIRFILAESEQAGGVNFRDKTELSRILKNSGLDTTAATDLAKFFSSIAEGDGELGYSRFTLVAERYQLPSTTAFVGTGTFQAPVSTEFPSSAGGIDFGVFAGDINADLAIANRYLTFMSLLSGDGSGGMSAVTTVELGAVQRDIQVVDVNGDGKDDLIVGIGRAPSSQSTTSDYTSSLAVSTSADIQKTFTADVNKDGVEDHITLAGDTLHVSIIDPYGMASPVNTTFPDVLSDLDIGDINNDGFADLLFQRNSGEGVGVMLGNGDGTFQFGDTGITSAENIRLSDVDGDGNLDIVAFNNTGLTFYVITGVGDGSFTTITSSPLSTSYPMAVAPVLADLDGDGDQDMLSATSTGVTDFIDVYINDGTNQFSYFSRVNSTPLKTIADLKVIDRDRDGDLDVVAVDSDSNELYIYDNDGFARFSDLSSRGITGTKIGIADLTGDGISDLMVFGTNNVYIYADPDLDGAYSVHNVIADGTFGLPFTNFYQVQALDVDGDGLRDLAVDMGRGQIYFLKDEGSTQAGFQVFLANGDGTYAANASFSSAKDFRRFITADINGDQVADLLVADGVDAGKGSISAYLGNADGSFSARQTFVLTNSGEAITSVATGRFDGSSTPGVVSLDSTGVIRVALGNGDGSYRAALTVGIGTARAASVAVGDVNGDGFDDISFVASGTDRKVFVVRGNGDGTFTAPISYVSSGDPTQIQLTDINGDGLRDIVTAGFGTNPLSVLIANTDGTFRASVSFSATAAGGTLRLGDLNGDGVDDIVISNGRGNSISVLIGNGETSTTLQIGSAQSSSTDPLAQDIRTLGGAKLALQAVRKLKKEIEKDLFGVEGVLGEVNAARRFALAGFLESQRLDRAGVGGLAEAQSVAESLARAIRTRLRDGQLSEHSALDTELVKELLAP